jgi:hypothetical protein
MINVTATTATGIPTAEQIAQATALLAGVSAETRKQAQKELAKKEADKAFAEAEKLTEPVITFYKNKPCLQLPTGTNKIFRFGKVKAELILKYINAIHEFARAEL